MEFRSLYADEFQALSLPTFSPLAHAHLLSPFADFVVSRYRSKKKAFAKSSEMWKDGAGGSLAIDENFNKIKKYCKAVRALCHTQVSSVIVKHYSRMYNLKVFWDWRLYAEAAQFV